MMEENPMYHYDQLSDAGADSDDSDASDSSNKSIGLPPSFRNLNLELKRNIEELNSEFDRNHQTLDEKIKELDDAIDELESMHKKTLREKIEKIFSDLQTTIHPMVELLCNIHNITEELEEKALNKFDIQRAARGTDLLKIAKVADLAETGKMCAEAAKEIGVYVKAVKALFLALDVYCIVQDAKEISEMNQPAGKRKEEEISSETVKFILQMKEAADQFKKTVKIIKDAKDTIDSQCCETTLPLNPGRDTEKMNKNVNKDGNHAYYFHIM